MAEQKPDSEATGEKQITKTSTATSAKTRSMTGSPQVNFKLTKSQADQLLGAQEPVPQPKSNVISPELASQLSQSEFIKDENLKSQLTSYAAPLMSPAEEAQVAEPAESEFTENLTGVPAPAPIQDKAQENVVQAQVDPSSMTWQERQEYLQTRLNEKDARMREKIMAGEVSPEEMVSFAKKQQKLAEKKAGEEAISARDREEKISGKYDMYLEKLNEVQENNKILAEQGFPTLPEPNISEFLDKSDMQFAVESDMEIPEAVAIKAKEEIDALAEAEALEAQKEIERKLARDQQSAAEVQAEQAKKSAENAKAAEEQVAKKTKEVEEEVTGGRGIEATNLSELFDSADTGRKFQTGFAIMLGGIAQGLMGSSVNPAIQQLDKIFKNNQEKKDLALEKMKQLVKSKENSTKGELELVKLRKAYADLEKVQLEIKQKRIVEVSGSMGGAALSDEQYNLLSQNRETREMLVTGPDNRPYKAVSKEAATELRKQKNETEPAINQLNQIIDLVGTYNKLNPLDPERAAMESRLTAIAGKLRIPLTGPGVLTDNEYKRLRNAIGDPNKIVTLDSIQIAKMRAVKDVLVDDLNIRYKNAGVPVSLSPREVVINEASRKYPNLSRPQIVRLLVKAKKIDYGI